MYKVKTNLSPLPVQELFKENDNARDLRKRGYWEAPNVKTVNYGLETIRYRGPKTWELLPKEIRGKLPIRIQSKSERMETTGLDM